MNRTIFTPIIIGAVIVLSLWKSFALAAHHKNEINYRSERVQIGNQKITITVPRFYSEYDLAQKIYIISKFTILSPADRLLTYKEVNEAMDWQLPKEWDVDAAFISGGESLIDVCDTDVHCAETDAYRGQGVIAITYAMPSAQFSWDQNKSLVKIGCSDGRVIMQDDLIDKFTACQSFDDAIFRVQEGLIEIGSGYSEFGVDIITLDAFIEEGMIFPNTSYSDTTPTSGKMLDLMRAHPDYPIFAMGEVIVDAPVDEHSGVRMTDNIDYWQFEIKLDRIMLLGTNHVPEWFADFCSTADIKPILVEEQYHPICIWE